MCLFTPMYPYDTPMNPERYSNDLLNTQNEIKYVRTWYLNEFLLIIPTCYTNHLNLNYASTFFIRTPNIINFIYFIRTPFIPTKLTDPPFNHNDT